MEFQLNSEDSHLLIQSVSVKSQKKGETPWTDFISMVTLTASLKYVVFNESEGRFIDERKIQSPILLLNNPYKAQPVFQLNTLIKNETFTLGINPQQKFYQTLKLALNDLDKLDDNYTLELTIEKFEIGD